MAGYVEGQERGEHGRWTSTVKPRQKPMVRTKKTESGEHADDEFYPGVPVRRVNRLETHEQRIGLLTLEGMRAVMHDEPLSSEARAALNRYFGYAVMGAAEALLQEGFCIRNRDIFTRESP